MQKALGIGITVVGFDSGEGLPLTTDSRNLLYAYPAKAYRMDQVALEKRIAGEAQLIIGDVARTVKTWDPDPAAPLGAVMFDMDYFTSTMDAFPLLTKSNVLPRIWCYFDDICGGPEEALTDRIGEREAIRLFNFDPERHLLGDHLSPAYVFKFIQPENWHQQVFLYHRLSHPDYDTCLHTDRLQQDPLRLSPVRTA